MNDTPFFTIGIASYNYANFILNSLNHIKKQMFTDYEVLISDDGSKDNSVEVIEEFISNNPLMNIRFIKKEHNEGLIANKNTLIENSFGKYLILCDADDWMSDDYLQVAYDRLKENNADRLICDVIHIDENGKIIQTEHIPENQTKWGWLIHHGSFYKTEIIKEHNIRINSEPDDVYFILEFSKYCKSLSIINEPHYYWFVHNDSEGRKKNNSFNDAFFDKYFIQEKELVINIRNGLDGKDIDYEKNSDELKLIYLKLYCRDILFRLQRVSLGAKYRYYNKLKKYSKKNIPGYWKCLSLKKSKKPVMRSFAMTIIRICKFMELSYLMYPFLLFYHVMTLFIRVDQ